MASLQSAARRGESLLQTETGLEFLGTIAAVDEGDVPSYDFTTPRTLLRVQPDCPVAAGIQILDVYGRRFAVANHAMAAQDNVKLYKVFRLYEMTHQVSWKRATTSNDPLTGLPKQSGKPELGPIWCAMEPFQREPIDLKLRLKEQVYRILTTASLALNDEIEGMVVKRLDTVLGVKLAEIQ
jgi:hypothetical protein